MDELPFRISAEAVGKWHALAERRRKHYIELYRSERWRRYYTEEVFLKQMHEVIEGVEHWSKVMDRWPAGAAPATSTRA